MLKRQSGFIITLELLLITTILIIGLSVGIVQIRDALIKKQVSQQSREISVIDNQNRRLGRTYGMDEHEAPLLAYFDNSVAGPEASLTGRAFIGVRDDRFTSREPVFYDGPSCTGNPCLKAVSDESYNLSVGGINNAGSVSYINALQGDINYAIGKASGTSVQGILLRSSAQMCPADIGDIQSVYLSQKVVSGMPCQPFELPTSEANMSCFVGVSNSGAGGGAINGVGNANGIGNGNGNGQNTPVETPEVCTQCPSGTTSQQDIVDNYIPELEPMVNDVISILSSMGLIESVDVTFGEICCPDNSRLNQEADLQDALLFAVIQQTYAFLGVDILSQPVILDFLASLGISPAEVNCIPDIQLTLADSVAIPGNPEVNVLDQFQAPFKVVVPQQAASDWYHVAPNGEGNLYTRPEN